MGAETGKINKMASGIMRAAECDLKRLNMGDQIAYAETTANGWPDGRYSIEAGGSGRMTIGCGAGRAYTIGDSVGRYSIGETGVNRLAGTVHKASEGSD